MEISVIITSYNQKEFLKEAIESVLTQSLMPDQIVVVDDASTDGSRELVDSYTKEYPSLFTVVQHDTNRGVASSRIDGLNSVTSDYICFLDGDDRFLPEKLKFDNRDAGIVYSNYYFISEDGNKRLYQWNENSNMPQGNIFKEVFSRSFPKETLFRSELVNYNAWKATGFHDPELMIYEDFDMKIRLTKHLKAIYCDVPLSEYRLNSAGLSQVDRIKHINTFIYIFNKNKGLLSDLKKAERKSIINKLRNRIIKFSLLKSRELMLNGNLSELISHNMKSVKYLLKFTE